MKVKFVILQLPVSNPNIFRRRKADSPELYLHDYCSIWEDEIDSDSNDIEIVLEDIYRIFNTEHPKHYAGRSLSVSDLVQVRYENKSETYYCDSFGFIKVNLVD